MHKHIVVKTNNPQVILPIKAFSGMKRLAGLIGILLIPALINRMIFRHAHRRAAVEVSDHFFRWRFGRVHYTVYGRGKPLLLIHGLGPGRDSQEWSACVELLAKKNRVYVIDLLGYGYSDTPPVTYSAYLYVSLINAFMLKVIRRPAVVIAEGISASYALMASDIKPHYFTKMVWVSPKTVLSALPHSVEGFLKEKLAYKHSLMRLGKKLLDSPLLGTTLYNLLTSRLCIRRSLRKLVHQPSNIRRLSERYYDRAHFGGPPARYIIGAQIGGFMDVDISRALKQTKIPIRMIWGTNNKENPVFNAAAFKQINPAIELIMIKHTAVMPYWESPRQFYRACKTFISQ